jgi:hypothetical protein
MKLLLWAAVFAALIFGGVYIKAWQCAELFPQANLLACLFWK